MCLQSRHLGKWARRDSGARRVDGKHAPGMAAPDHHRAMADQGTPCAYQDTARGRAALYRAEALASRAFDVLTTTLDRALIDFDLSDYKSPWEAEAACAENEVRSCFWPLDINDTWKEFVRSVCLAASSSIYGAAFCVDLRVPLPDVSDDSPEYEAAALARREAFKEELGERAEGLVGECLRARDKLLLAIEHERWILDRIDGVHRPRP